MVNEIIRLLTGKRISLMVALEIAVSLGLLSVGISLMSITAPFVLIPFGIVSLVGFGDALRRILSETNFKNRIVNYIAEGKAIHHSLIARDSVYTGESAIKTLNQWTNKIAEDIRKNKSSAEVDLFIDQGHALNLDDIDGNTEQAREKQVRMRVANTFQWRLEHLEELLQRL